MWIRGWKSAKCPRKVQPPTGKQSYTSINQLPAVDWDIQPHQLPTKSKKTSYNLQDFNGFHPKTAELPSKKILQRISSQLNPLRGEICTGDASVKTAFIRLANPEILGHNNQWTDVLHVVGQFPGNNLWTSKKHGNKTQQKEISYWYRVL